MKKPQNLSDLELSRIDSLIENSYTTSPKMAFSNDDVVANMPTNDAIPLTTCLMAQDVAQAVAQSDPYNHGNKNIAHIIGNNSLGSLLDSSEKNNATSSLTLKELLAIRDVYGT